MHSPLFPYAASLLDPPRPPTRNSLSSPQSKIPYDLFHLCNLTLVISLGVYLIKQYHEQHYY